MQKKDYIVYMGKVIKIAPHYLEPPTLSKLQIKTRQTLGPYLSTIRPNSEKDYYGYHKIRQDREKQYKEQELERLKSEKALHHTSQPETDNVEPIGQDTDSSNADYCTIS